MPVDLDLFEPFDGLVEVTVCGRSYELPDSNCLLRALQYVAGDAIARGRFCWNDECGNCEVTLQAPDGGGPRVVRACQERVSPGMIVTEISEEILLDTE